MDSFKNFEGIKRQEARRQTLETLRLKQKERRTATQQLFSTKNRNSNYLGYDKDNVQKETKMMNGKMTVTNKSASLQPLDMAIGKSTAVPPTTFNNDYRKLYDPQIRESQNSPKVTGMTYRFSNQAAQRQRNIGRVFPMHDLQSTSVAYKTTRKAFDVNESQLYAEAANKDKLYFKQKFFMKDFKEELLRSNVNPNKA